ncbi:hypothetical protein APA_2986 [Pseudanabaena sp. lw0831]|nr:hypothetical protein APA_2986 [Pseudanabaena sp. lw0831]
MSNLEVCSIDRFPYLSIPQHQRVLVYADNRSQVYQKIQVKIHLSLQMLIDSNEKI